MIEAGFETTDPITGTNTRVLEANKETNGSGWTLEVRCPAGAAPHILEHIHLTWTESFKIISGTAHYKLDGEKKSAQAGDTLIMPPGKAHIHPWNAGDTDMIYHQINVFDKPSTDAVEDVIGVFATLNGLAREGKLGKRGLPKNPLQFAATLRTLVKHEGFDAKVPIPVQRATAATLGKLAVSLGYASRYDRFTEQASVAASKL